MKKIVLALLLSLGSLFAFEELTEQNFDQKIANKNVIIDFHAQWWSACKILGKNLTKYDAGKTDDVTIYKVDIEAQGALAKRFKVVAIPLLVYMKDGMILAHERGIKTPEEIDQSVKKYFK